MRSRGCPNAKLVVTLYYYEELTLREIGEVLGVTEPASPSSTRRSSASRPGW
jgi:DNA-directed RNA polymerase specialized sigma24 family protein